MTACAVKHNIILWQYQYWTLVKHPGLVKG